MDKASSKLDTLIDNIIVNVEKSSLDILNMVKTTIVKMFVNRGFIDKENENKYIKSFTSDINDDMEYILNLDNKTNYNMTIKEKKIYIKIFDYKISSINKISPIGEFLTKFNNNYKFIVVHDISSKAEKIIKSYNTEYEVFKIDELKINIVDHVLVPKHIVLLEEEGIKTMNEYNSKKKDMPFLQSFDPIVRYYAMKPDNVCKIIRPSIMTAETVFYRLVVKGGAMKAKT